MIQCLWIRRDGGLVEFRENAIKIDNLLTTYRAKKIQVDQHEDQKIAGSSMGSISEESIDVGMEDSTL
jgi:hypothetical protein